MPIHKTKNNKWQFGTKGKKYNLKSQAEKQMRAIKVSESKDKNKHN